MSNVPYDYWLEIEAVLREIHKTEAPFTRWAGSVDEFVKDILDMAKESYLAGQLDTLEDVRMEVRNLERKLDSGL